jgi:hypothetical protein
MAYRTSLQQHGILIHRHHRRRALHHRGALHRSGPLHHRGVLHHKEALHRSGALHHKEDHPDVAVAAQLAVQPAPVVETEAEEALPEREAGQEEEVPSTLPLNDFKTRISFNKTSRNYRRIMSVDGL